MTTTTTLAAVAAAASALSDEAIAAAAASAAPSPAPAEAAPEAPAPSAAAPALSAATALELASLALPSVRDQLTALAQAAGGDEAAYRAACLTVAKGGSAASEPLSTSAPTTAVVKPDAAPKAAIPAAANQYKARAQAMAGA